MAIYQGQAEFKGKAVWKTKLSGLVANGHLTAAQLGTMRILCRQHNFAVERSFDRGREDRRALFAEAFKAALRESRLRPKSEKEELIAQYMRTHSVTGFWFYPDVNEDQLWTLAQEHFPKADEAEADEAAVVDLASLVTDDGVRSTLKTVANRGTSKGSPVLLVSTSRDHLKTCDHRHWRGDKWVARVYLKWSTTRRGEPCAKLECADCSSEKALERKRKRRQQGD
jgi:hypothetical protein